MLTLELKVTKSARHIKTSLFCQYTFPIMHWGFCQQRLTKCHICTAAHVNLQKHGEGKFTLLFLKQIRTSNLKLVWL